MLLRVPVTCLRLHLGPILLGYSLTGGVSEEFDPAEAAAWMPDVSMSGLTVVWFWTRLLVSPLQVRVFCSTAWTLLERS